MGKMGFGVVKKEIAAANDNPSALRAPPLTQGRLYGAVPITQPSRGGLRRVQTVVLNRRTGARRLRDERGVMGVVRGI